MVALSDSVGVELPSGTTENAEFAEAVRLVDPMAWLGRPPLWRFVQFRV